MSEIRLVVFDCDGVMFDSRGANRAYYNQIRAHFGHPPMDDEELEYVHMHRVEDSVRYIFRHYPDDLAAAEGYHRTLDYTPFLRYMNMEPDLIRFLDYLRPQRKTAISTNRTTTMPVVLEMFQLASYFDQVVTAHDVANPKPHPEALERIMANLGVGPAHTIYIGDSQVDRDHTAAAGVPLIAFKNPDLQAEYHVASFMEITELPPFGG
ncbi:HAD family hydrolase [Desulfurivibrio alkaliphilus]|uniref:phosphoglycolate phosphatase n=1 Tax=Desulfurivibrio alkaliphilus (strain DSM 19089 / UNIQEM U267 / AHT2) TaxID=589865 RepID=D6Z5H6_DESAT|nr:HAD family hydrolase [Desulfurivibrio alkaliphilus]ADH86713.1 HAD-superfamily hydrolase, subfamily IA, variant 3 [Desulfurivibrio alkaliphilus AHT 2]